MRNSDLLKELEDLRTRVQSLEASKAELGLYAEIVANMAEGVCLIRAGDGVIAYCNPKYERLFDYDPDELVGKHISVVNAPTDKSPKETADKIIKTLNEKGVWIGDILNKKKDGTTFWSHAVVSKFENPAHGKVWISLQQDITAQRAAEAEKEKLKQMLEGITQGITESIMLLSTDFKIKWANKTALAQAGLPSEEIIGNYCYKAIHHQEQPCDSHDNSCPLYAILKTGEPTSGVHTHHDKSGNKVFVEVNVYPIRNEAGEIIEIVHVSKDITERRKMEEDLRTLSLTDELSGLYNRRGFFASAEQLQKIAKREKKGLFMLYVDLDGLKEINDTYGHQDGDKALREIADILKETYRESDIIARLGGDEFAVFPIGTEGDDIEEITSRMQENIDRCNEESTRGYKLSMSWGVAYFDPAKPLPIDAMLNAADKAMYEQKQSKQ